MTTTKTLTLLAVVAAASADERLRLRSVAPSARGKVSPDEFRVVSQAPLTLPPDYSLRPPRPGEPRPQELQPADEARQSLFGQDVGASASQGERQLVNDAHADATDPNIRDTIDFENQGIVHRNQGFVDRLLSFGGGGFNQRAPRSASRAATPRRRRLDPPRHRRRASHHSARQRRLQAAGHLILAQPSCVAPPAFSPRARRFVCFASSSDARPFARPETFTLSNGLQVVVITDRRAPVVTHQLWYRVGAADEPRGHSGMAHFFEHLLFKGTRQVPRSEFSRIIARNGGEDNASTNWDYTVYYERIARDRLELVMRMEADRMRNLQLPASLIASERDVIIEERRTRVDNSPGAVMGERMRAMLHPKPPYGTPVIGWLSEMRQLDHDRALEFYRTWYAPNNAILVVAGDINAAELRPIVERTYGRAAADAQFAGAAIGRSDPAVRRPDAHHPS